MSRAAVFQRAFAAGEIAPQFHARADLAKYATGLKTCKNFIVLKPGGIANRPGLRFLAECKTTSDDVKLIKFVHEIAGESILIEHGLGYFRFFKGDEPVMDGADIYEVAAPFDTTLYTARQDGHIIVLTHTSLPPYELRYNAADDWDLVAVSTAPGIAAPANPVATEGVASGARVYGYVVTAVMEETYEESLPSEVASCGPCGEATADAPNTLVWDAVTGAVEYIVYSDPFNNGTFGFIGRTTQGNFNDAGFVADFAVTPPIGRELFNAENQYPATSATYGQRRFYGRTLSEPGAIWASRTGFPSNFGITSPLRDDDALTFKIAGNGNHAVQHLVPLKQLIALTSSGGWTVGTPKEALSPNNIPIDQDIYVGSHDKEPSVVGNRIIFCEARGGTLFDVGFDQAVEGLAGRDLCLYADHLLEGRSIARFDYARHPHSVVWVVHGGGTFLGMTYLPNEEMVGWHQHTSQGASFDDVCVVPGTDEDVVYLLVTREIEGETRRYIERLASRIIDEDDIAGTAFFLDSGITYEGAAATLIPGIEHLEDEVVYALADGIVRGPFTVSDGSITLPAAASVVHVGLRIEHADAELLDLDVVGSNVRDKKKRAGSVKLLVDKSSRTFKAGPDDTHLRQYVQQRFESTEDVFTGPLDLNITSTFSESGSVLIRQTDPLPLTILAVLPNLELGG